MKKLLLAGNSMTADILAAYLRSDTRYEVLACVVDDDFVNAAGVEGLPTLGLSQLVGSYYPEEVSFLMAMGYNDLNRGRERMFNRLKDMGYTIETWVHPDARVYTGHPLGEGALIFPGAMVEPHARVGANTLIWGGVVVAHHASVADHCWVAANSVISGQAVVERNTFVGVSATLVNRVVVGEFNIIGAAALITKDTKPGAVHLARSAEQLRYSSEDYVKYFGV